MKIPNKKWLDSLLPLTVAAKQFTKGDEDLCWQGARVYDSLVLIGVNADLFVDANRFNYYLYQEKSERSKTRGRRVLHLHDGHTTAANLQDLINDLEVHLFSNLSRIAALHEANSHTTNSVEIEQNSLEMEGLRIQLPAFTQARKKAVDKLEAIVRDFGFTPAVVPSESEPTPTAAKSPKKTLKKAAKKVTVKREPPRSR